MFTAASRALIWCMAVLCLSCTEHRPLHPPNVESPTHEPWEDAEAENLAWLISGDIYASKGLYDRIRGDLAQIRQQWGDSIPGLRTIKHFPMSSPWILPRWTQQVRDEVRSGDYHDWDSLNALFGARITQDFQIVSDNRVNFWRMMQSYELLRGILSLELNANVGDRANVYAYLHDWGIAYLYRRAGGDCILGCIWSEMHYFRSDSKGIEHVGVWEWDPCDDSIPRWWREAEKCWDLYRYGDSKWRFRDATPPARITDLRLVGDQIGPTVTLAFTAPGDDGDIGIMPPSSYYEICWLPEPVNEENWGSPDLPPHLRPITSAHTSPPGETVLLTLNRLRSDTVNFIGLVSIDLSPLATHMGISNRSQISNIVVSRNTAMGK